jgi:VanZ family protein
MLPLRYRERWQLAGLFLLLLALSAALMPAVWFWDDKSKAWSWFGQIDKWVHGVTFFVLAVWFCGIYRRNSYWRIAIGLLAFGMFIELCQRMLSYRTAEWFDVAADAAGIVAGLIVGLAGMGGWCLRAENYFARQTSD